MLESLVQWISYTIIFLSYTGIAILMFLEGVIFFLPSELILPFAGYLALAHGFNVPLMIVAATIGSVVGSTVIYEMSRRSGQRLIHRYGTYVFISDTHLAWAQGLFQRHGDKTIFFSRLIPVIRYFINIPAGIAKVSRPKFLLYTSLGALIWNTALIMFGYGLGKEWGRILYYSQSVQVLFLIIIVGIIGWLLLREIERRALGILKKK